MNRRLPLAITLVLLTVAFNALAASADPKSPGVPASTPPSGAAPLAPAGSGFTYQGRLTSVGPPATGNYDFQFTLYDALTGGNVAGGPVTLLSQTVSSGLFTAPLDFGPN